MKLAWVLRRAVLAMGLGVVSAAGLAQSGAVGGVPLAPVAEVRARLEQDKERAAQLARLRRELQPILTRYQSDPSWLVSRLQMYWQGRHTQVFIKNSLYDHAEGQAPVPTVRFTGGRDTVTAYFTPKLEDVKPYMGENDLLWLQRRDGAQPWELVHQSKTGRIIEAINMRVAETARDAAFLYWLEGNEDAGRMAFEVLDTYLSGILHRQLPTDLQRGHDQNIVGMQAYEVIQEGIIMPLTEAYVMLARHVDGRPDGKRASFDAALKKWADVQLLNGVPWNNWNLIKARFVLQIASVLGDDRVYADGKGRQHYVRAVVDGQPPRHWGLQRLMEFGYDKKSAMWNESASYSLNVLDDFAECIDVLDRNFGIDMADRLALVFKAASVLPQYMLPNGRKIGFGDSRYELFHTNGVERLLAYAQRHARVELAARLREVLAAMQDAGATSAVAAAKPMHAVLAADVRAPVVEPVKMTGLQTPTYHSANTSWLIQRNGYAGPAAADALVVSMVGANGNHAHANGVAMELFAKGMSLAPESGRGSGYFQADYRDYYSQFPAHNTVVVDGISAYPAMKVEQPFRLLSAYPRPGAPLASADLRITVGEVDFVEPASQADQRRLLATVRIDDTHAYVVDVFRSRRRAGGDRYHDYILHGLGQTLQLTQGARTLATAPSNQLSFADGDLYGYEYWYDRQSLRETEALQANFGLALPDRKLGLKLWLQGGAEREFFTVKAPPSTAWPRGMLPGNLDQQPSPTLVIRQTGAAWDRPFAVVMEASRDGETPAVREVKELQGLNAAPGSVGLAVSLEGGHQHLVVSNAEPGTPLRAGGAELVGRMALVGTQGQQLERLFMTDAKSLAAQGARLECAQARCASSLWQADGQWFYASDGELRLTLPAQGDWVRKPAAGRASRAGGRVQLVLPAAGPTRLF